MEKEIWDIIEEYKIHIFIGIIIILALYVRIPLLNMVSDDYASYLQPWSETLKENGGFFALKYDVGNYNAPYMTILAGLTYLPIDSLIAIKIVSMLFDYICALFAAKITFELIKDRKNKMLWAALVFAIVIFLPTVILNSACWAQCDSIYTAFILISIYYLIKEKYFNSFVFLSISFAFKLQGIFMLPLYILFYISKRKFSCKYFLIIPIANFIMSLPALILGKSILSWIRVYFEQGEANSECLGMNFPSIYSIFFNNYNNFTISPNENIRKIGVLITLFVFGMIAFVVLYKKIDFNKQTIVEFGLWTIMIATFFLPGMHERYLFVGDILSILYVVNNREKIYIPIGISSISLYCYCHYLFGVLSISLQYLGIFYGVLLITVSKDMCKKYFMTDKKDQISNIN